MIDEPIHLGQPLDSAVLDSIADFICGDEDMFPEYRTGSGLTRFFNEININATHDGSTRKRWTLEILKQLSASSQEKVILRLVNPKIYKGDRGKLKTAVDAMNSILLMDGLCIKFAGVTPGIYKIDNFNLDANEIIKSAGNEEKEFLEKQFSDDIDISKLCLDGVITEILQDRVREIKSLPKNKTPLCSIFLIGSTLEGILLGVMLKDQRRFMSNCSAPKDKSGKTKKIYDWTLSELINVAENERIIGKDVKKFSHALRDFRNYIHPYQQMSQMFNPSDNTAKICWQVFVAAYSELADNI